MRSLRPLTKEEKSSLEAELKIAKDAHPVFAPENYETLDHLHLSKESFTLYTF